MEIIRIKFDEVSNISLRASPEINGTYFDFKSGDLEITRAYVVGTPKVESGMEVTLALGRFSKWGRIPGWINHTTGETSIPACRDQVVQVVVALIGLVWISTSLYRMLWAGNFDLFNWAPSPMPARIVGFFGLGVVWYGILTRSYRAILYYQAGKRLSISWTSNQSSNTRG